MGMRLDYLVFRETDRAAIYDAVSQTLEEQSLAVFWDQRLTDPQKEIKAFYEISVELQKNNQGLIRFSATDHTTTIYLPHFDSRYTLSKSLGKILNVPWFDLRIQEGNHWDYSFYVGENHLDQYSADPSYWREKKRNVKNNPKLIAEKWNIPVDSIARYLKHWTWYRRRKKAYPSDEAPYGSYRQFFDFMRAIRAVEPTTDLYPITLPEKA